MLPPQRPPTARNRRAPFRGNLCGVNALDWETVMRGAGWAQHYVLRPLWAGVRGVFFSARGENGRTPARRIPIETAPNRNRTIAGDPADRISTTKRFSRAWIDPHHIYWMPPAIAKVRTGAPRRHRASPPPPRLAHGGRLFLLRCSLSATARIAHFTSTDSLLLYTS